MKRKRNQNEEGNNNSKYENSDKKMRVVDEDSKDDIREEAVLNSSLLETKEFVLTREIADNSILCDIAGNKWRIGGAIGAGSFGEIYLASNDISKPVDVCNANYVTKIEPHSNGPLFVEIHCLLNVNKDTNALENGNNDTIDEERKLASQEVLGIPKYIASGSHYFNESRYRFLIMPRYKADLHSITKNGRLSQKHFLIIASQTIDVLQRLHEKCYVHSDIKAQNIMIGQFDTNSSINDFASNSYNYNSYNSSSNNHQQIKQPQGILNGFKKGSNRPSVQFGGSNPLRSCRIKEDSHDKSHHTVYNDMVRSHYLRPGRTVDYAIDEASRSSHNQDSEMSDSDEDDEDFELGGRKKRGPRGRNNKRKMSKSPSKNTQVHAPPMKMSISNEGENTEDDHVYLIDYGLATKFIDTNGEHRPFCMDQRRAHDGTIEFTSRDAHFGAHSRRSDLECFGYNLIYWSQGYLPWKDEKLKDQPEIVHRLKEIFMTDVKEMLKLLYGKDVPKYLGDYMHYVGQLEFDEEPNYSYLKGLFEKEFLKLGLQKSDMKLNLNEVRDGCEPIDRTISEHDLMMSIITDLKTVTKLGFLVASTDSVDGNETLVKPKESLSLNLSCKASPKNLRSKEKGSKGKRPKRERKVLTEKEIISEKMAKGKKLSIQEIATLDPEQIARDRAEKEYEKFDEKAYYQTPQRYKGNPTYAILEIENRLRSKNGSAVTTAAVSQNNSVVGSEIEPIKGYTKPMMDVLKKQQMIVEQIIEQNSPISTYQKRNREGLRNVIKHTQKNITYQNEVNLKKTVKKTRQGGRKRRSNATKRVNRRILDETNIDASDKNESEEITPQVSSSQKTKKRGRPIKRRGRTENVKKNQKLSEEPPQEEGNSDEQAASDDSDDEPLVQVIEKKRKIRSRAMAKNPSRTTEIVAPETEEDSVYYDIPGEGSNDGINANSDSEGEDAEEVIKPVQKRLRKRDFLTSGDENSNHSSGSGSVRQTKRRNDRYYKDDDFEVYTDEASNQSSVSFATKTSVSFKPTRRVAKTNNVAQESGKVTRNKTKSRSTSRSAAPVVKDHSESETEEEEEGSEYEVDESLDGNSVDQDVSEDENEDTDMFQTESEIDDDEDSDSIDIKYSPLKTRNARRRITCFNMKQIRDRRMNDDVRNFRLVSTRG